MHADIIKQFVIARLIHHMLYIQYHIGGLKN